VLRTKTTTTETATRFNETAPLHKSQYLELRVIEPANFILKLLLLLALITISGLGISLADYPLKLAFQVLLGAGLAHATELVHQCIHRTAFGKGRWDHIQGQLLAFPSGTSFYYYRWFHLWHHRHNGTELDRESFDYTYQMMGDRSRRIRLLGFARHLLMLGHYQNTLHRLYAAITGRLAAELREANPQMKLSTAREIQRDYQVMAILLLSALLLSVLFTTDIVITLWLIPLLVGWAPIHALVELPEHWRCDKPEPNVFRNTRSINASSFARWYTNNNCNHVGHHLDMSIPLEKLPQFEKILAQGRRFGYREDSYFSFYSRFFYYLWTGKDQPLRREITVNDQEKEAITR
jgi:fatty acid desaturase